MPRNEKKRFETRIGWGEETRIHIYGHDLTEDLMGKLDLGGMAFLELTGRLPSAGDAVLINAMLVALVEHGITPSALATRLTQYGAPESIQGAVAAGLLGLGNVFVGTMEGAARMLQDALRPDGTTASTGADEEPLEKKAERIVAEHRRERRILPGFGHPIHKPDDPRAIRLINLAKEHGRHGQFIALLLAVSAEADRQFGKHLVLNVTGVIGALACEMGIDWRFVRGIGVMARAVGLVGHIREELERPMGPEIWFRVEEEATEQLRGAGSGNA